MKETFGERHDFKQFLTQLGIFKGENKLPFYYEFFQKRIAIKI
jgi:hypothetical protein